MKMEKMLIVKRGQEEDLTKTGAVPASEKHDMGADPTGADPVSEQAKQGQTTTTSYTVDRRRTRTAATRNQKHRTACLV